MQSELTDLAHGELIEECSRQRIRFMTTCFDIGRVDFLASLGMGVIKVGSPDLTSRRMLEALRARFAHVIISTGVGTDEEVAEAAEWLRSGQFTLLHCVSLYPMPPSQAHLRRMQWLRRFTPSVGWSDHAEGLDVAKLAIAAGASFVEKHFCLGRNGPGRAMAWDATPDDIAELVRYARDTDEIMGDQSAPQTTELAAAKARFIGRWGDNA